MIRQIRLLVPTGAAGLSRVLQLALLVVLTQLSGASAEGALVTGFALLSAFAIITDSGASNYLLSLPPAELNRTRHTKAIGFHALLAAMGALIAVLLTVSGSTGPPDRSTTLIVCALAVSQVLDSLTRTIRAPLLVGRRDATYAMPDLLLVGGKSIPIALAVVSAEIDILLTVPLASLVVFAGTWLLVRRSLPAADRNDSGIFPQIFEYGLSGSASALYSQAPLVLGTALLGVDAVAPLAIAYRVVQPLEVLPGTLSQQLVPRIRESARPASYYWVRFFAGGLVMATVLLALREQVELLFGGTTFDQTIFFIVLASVAPKFGNYALVAYSMGSGLVRVRLVATVMVGVVAVVLTVITCLVFDENALVAVTLISECLLSIVIAILLTKRKESDAT